MEHQFQVSKTGVVYSNRVFVGNLHTRVSDNLKIFIILSNLITVLTIFRSDTGDILNMFSLNVQLITTPFYNSIPESTRSFGLLRTPFYNKLLQHFWWLTSF